MNEKWDILRQFLKDPGHGQVLAISVGKEEQDDTAIDKTLREVSRKQVKCKQLADEGFIYCFKSAKEILIWAEMLNHLAKENKEHDLNCLDETQA